MVDVVRQTWFQKVGIGKKDLKKERGVLIPMAMSSLQCQLSVFSASSAPSPASLHITLLQHFQGEDRDAGAPQSKQSVAWTCLTAWPVLPLGSVQVDSATRASCYAFVCRQLLVWLIVWPSSNLSGRMEEQSERLRGEGKAERCVEWKYFLLSSSCSLAGHEEASEVTPSV